MSTNPTRINLNDTIPGSPNGEVLVKWQGDNSDPRNVSAYVPFSSPTEPGAMFNVADLGGTGQAPTVVGISGIEIDQRILPTEDFQTVRFVADGVSDSGIAFGHLKFGHLTGGVDARTTASETIAKSSHASCVTFADVSPASDIAVALDSTVNAHFWCFVRNATASHALNFTPSSGSINVSTLASGSAAALFFDGTNWTLVTFGGGSAATWGSITGTLSAQTDLQSALNAKLTNPMTTAGDIIVGGTSGTPTRVAASSTVGLVLASNGAGVAPSYQSVGSVALPSWLASHPDSPPSSPNAMDDEFNAGSLDAKWTTWSGESGISRAFSNSRALISCSGATRSWMYQSLPAGTGWEFRMKLGMIYKQANSVYAGFYLADTSATKVGACVEFGNEGNFYFATWGSGLASGASVTGGPFPFAAAYSLYLSAYYDGTNVYFYHSNDGVGDARTKWWFIGSLTKAQCFPNGTPGYIGPFGNHANTNIPYTVDWFRRIS